MMALCISMQLVDKFTGLAAAREALPPARKRIAKAGEDFIQLYSFRQGAKNRNLGLRQRSRNEQKENEDNEEIATWQIWKNVSRSYWFSKKSCPFPCKFFRRP